MAIGGPGPIGGPGTIGGPPVGGTEYDQNVTANVDLAVNLTALKAFLETVVAFVDLAVVQQARTISKNVAALTDLAASFRKAVTHTITAALVDLAASFRKSVGKTITAALIDLAATITAIKTRTQSVTAAVKAAASFRKAISRTVTAAGIVAGRKLSTGNVLAGVGANVNTATDAWVNPGNITADDGTNATIAHVSGIATSDALKASTFGLTIPGGASIRGIEVVFQLSKTAISGDVTVNSVNVGKSDATLGTPLTPATVLTASAVNYTYGGPTSLWGLTWTADEINAATFQTRLDALFTNGVVQINADVAWVNVYYVPSLVTKAVSKFLTPLIDLATAIAGVKARSQTVAATVKAAVTARRSVGKIVTPLVRLAASFRRAVARTIKPLVRLMVGVTASSTTTTSKTVTAFFTASVTVSRALTLARTITALVDLAVTARKSVGKRVTALIDLTVSISVVIAGIVQQAVTASITASVSITRSITVTITALVAAGLARLHTFVCYVQDISQWTDAPEVSDTWAVTEEQSDATEEQEQQPEPACCDEE